MSKNELYFYGTFEKPDRNGISIPIPLSYEEFCRLEDDERRYVVKFLLAPPQIGSEDTVLGAMKGGFRLEGAWVFLGRDDCGEVKLLHHMEWGSGTWREYLFIKDRRFAPLATEGRIFVAKNPGLKSEDYEWVDAVHLTESIREWHEEYGIVESYREPDGGARASQVVLLFWLVSDDRPPGEAGISSPLP